MAGMAPTVAVLSRKGKKVSSARCQRVTCRGAGRAGSSPRRVRPLADRERGANRSRDYRKQTEASRRMEGWVTLILSKPPAERPIHLFVKWRGTIFGKAGFCRHHQTEKESGEEAAEVG